MTRQNKINKMRRAVLIIGTASAFFVLGYLVVAGFEGTPDIVASPAEKTAESMLFEAARKGDCVLAAYACGQGADINSRNVRGMTALAIAAERGDEDLSKLLLANGSKTEIANFQGDTPLVLAAAAGHLPIVKYLLESGADGNAGSENCRTPLLMACENGHAGVAAYLLKRGVHRYSGLNQGRGPWARTLQYRHINTAKVLLEHGCDINETDVDGNNALMMAIKLRSEELVRQILEQKTLNMDHRNKSGQTARQLAETLNDEKIIQLLKDH